MRKVAHFQIIDELIPSHLKESEPLNTGPKVVYVERPGKWAWCVKRILLEKKIRLST
jgi:hypothetical protein